MARYTSAYVDFTHRLSEVLLLKQKARNLERKIAVARPQEINALCRSAVVLLSSHIEGYVKDLAEISLDRIYEMKVSRGNISGRFFHSISRDKFDELRDTSDPEKLSEKFFALIESDIKYWDRNGPFQEPVPFERFVKGFASPSVDKIGTFFLRFGYPTYKRDMQRKLGRDYRVTITMIENIVSTRNNIAHGDAIITRTPRDVGDMLELAKSFCLATDDVFAKWFKHNFCTIRQATQPQ